MAATHRTSWPAAYWVLAVVLVLQPALGLAAGNVTCLDLQWGLNGTVQCGSACDVTCQVGCGSMNAIFTNGIFDGLSVDASGCSSLGDCPADASVAVNALASLFANLSVVEYARAETPGNVLPGDWGALGIDSVTPIDVTGTIDDPLINWGVSASTNPLDPFGLLPSSNTGRINMDAQASVLESPTDVIVVARGSENQTADWVDVNANAFTVPMEALGNRGQVHRGFVTYAMALEPNVTKLLQAANDRAAAANTTTRLWLTGHSLGGAASILLAMFYNQQYIKTGKWSNIELAGVYTFGSPMPGNAPFAAFYNENLGDKTFRFVTRDANYDTLDLNWDDAVTLVPPRLTPDGYTQVGRYKGVYCEGGATNSSRVCFSKEIDPASFSWAFAPPTDPTFSRHNISRYADDLSRAVLISPNVDKKDLCTYTATIRCWIVGASSGQCASEKAANALNPGDVPTSGAGTGSGGGGGSFDTATNAGVHGGAALATAVLLALGAALLL